MADQPTNDGRDDVDIDLTDATIAEERREANTAHVADLRHTDAAPKAAREPRVKRSVRMSEQEMNELGADSRGEGRV